MVVDVQGLDGFIYLDKFENYVILCVQQGDWNLCDLCDFGCSDCIYIGVGGCYVFKDFGLKWCIEVIIQGSCLLVVWNLGQVGVVGMVDVGVGWCNYVCLEVVNVGLDVIILLVGVSYMFIQIFCVLFL